MRLVCRLLDGEGHGNLQIYCPQFCSNQIHCRSHCLHFWDPAEHLCLVIPAISEHWADSSVACWLLIFGMDFQLMRFYRQRLLAGALHWKTCGVANWLVQLYCSYVYEVYYSKKVFICIMQLRLRSFRYVMMYVLLINKMWAHTALHFCWRKEAKTGQCSTYKCKPKFSIVMNSYMKYHEEVGLRQCVLIEFMSVNGLCCSL